MLYVPIPFYHNNSNVASGYWRITLTSLATNVNNIITTLFPSLQLQIGKVYSYNGYNIVIEDMIYEPDGRLCLYVRIISIENDAGQPVFDTFIFGALGGIGIASSSFAIDSITRLDENFFTVILVYGLIAYFIYKIIK
jgi:hypothetical protein